jgi:hypothetical protein
MAFRLQFRLLHAENQRPAEDLGPLRARVLHPADGWQGQCWAHPVQGDLYEMSLPVPGAGDCCLFFTWPGSGSHDPHLRYVILQKSRPTFGANGRAGAPAPMRHQC